MQGLLLVNKPLKWTSFDVVAKVRGVVSAHARANGLPRVKVGHTGTLDPMATGLLVLAIGSYTKKISSLTKQDKTYEATITLGSTSPTDDVEGELTKYNDLVPTQQEVEKALLTFVGKISQVPPNFSAIKVGGIRSYNAARKGKTLKLEPREVNIYSINDIAYAYPNVSCVLHVGSGTYIRSIARDLGQKLGTGAYLSALKRTSVGGYSLKNAVDPLNISFETVAKNILA